MVIIVQMGVSVTFTIYWLPSSSQSSLCRTWLSCIPLCMHLRDAKPKKERVPTQKKLSVTLKSSKLSSFVFPFNYTFVMILLMLFSPSFSVQIYARELWLRWVFQQLQRTVRYFWLFRHVQCRVPSGSSARVGLYLLRNQSGFLVPAAESQTCYPCRYI
jgi:hypothetical protein